MEAKKEGGGRFRYEEGGNERITVFYCVNERVCTCDWWMVGWGPKISTRL